MRAGQDQRAQGQWIHTPRRPSRPAFATYGFRDSTDTPNPHQVAPPVDNPPPPPAAAPLDTRLGGNIQWLPSPEYWMRHIACLSLGPLDQALHRITGRQLSPARSPAG